MNCNDSLFHLLNPAAKMAVSRRTFLRQSASGIGLAALGGLLGASPASPASAAPGALGGTHHPAKAKRIIYLFQSGAPSQIDLFDPKPQLLNRVGQDLPESIRQGQRLTGMTSGQAKFPVTPGLFKFAQHGKCGAWLSELLPHTAKIVDDACIVRSLHTEAINHDPAITFLQTGAQIAGRPSIGSWLAYGLGSENKDLPAYIVLTSRGSGRANDQPLYDRLWAAGFLSSKYAGVRFRRSGDPVPFLADPDGISRETRRSMLDDLGELNRQNLAQFGDPETAARIEQYEMAFRMQASVPDLVDLSKEPASVREMYGPEVSKPGSYAFNCLLARRLAERDVRFIQLFHMGWDHHNDAPKALRGQCQDTDQPTAALLTDLKQRGLLDDTLVVWGGEFGRTIYSQGALTATNYGRDHHPRCFTVWMAGGGVKPGLTYGATDDYSYNIIENPVHVRDLHATILRLMGIHHEKLTYKYQGLDFKLTGVEPAKVVKELLA
jgi:hypothetical protein